MYILLLLLNTMDRRLRHLSYLWLTGLLLGRVGEWVPFLGTSPAAQPHSLDRTLSRHWGPQMRCPLARSFSCDQKGKSNSSCNSGRIPVPGWTRNPGSQRTTHAPPTLRIYTLSFRSSRQEQHLLCPSPPHTDIACDRRTDGDQYKPEVSVSE